MLRQKFGFTCACALCALPEEARARSDACQRALGDLQPEEGLPLPELLKRLDVKMALMAREGLPEGWARPMLLHALVAAVHDKTAEGRERASKLHARALETLRVSIGTDHPNYKIIASFLQTVAQFDGVMGAHTATQTPSASGRAARKGKAKGKR